MEVHPEPAIPRLLLVEDSEDDAFFFARALKRSGIRCHLSVVNDGAAAISTLDQGARDDRLPRFVFLDLKLPTLSGFDVLRWMSGQSFAGQVCVIILSGSGEQRDRDQARDLGACEYLVKPIDERILRQTLAQAAAANLSTG